MLGVGSWYMGDIRTCDSFIQQQYPAGTGSMPNPKSVTLNPGCHLGQGFARGSSMLDQLKTLQHVGLHWSDS